MCSPAARKLTRDVQLEPGDGLALRVLEVGAAVGDERLAQASSRCGSARSRS